MIQDYNRVVRLEKFTYYDALKLAYKLVKEKADELDEVDINHQNLSGDYKLTMLALSNLFNAGEENIIK